MILDDSLNTQYDLYSDITTLMESKAKDHLQRLDQSYDNTQNLMQLDEDMILQPDEMKTALEDQITLSEVLHTMTKHDHPKI